MSGELTCRLSIRIKLNDLNIEFSVRRVSFGAEVFDVHLVNIPRRNNEHHRHADESLLSVTRGCRPSCGWAQWMLSLGILSSCRDGQCIRLRIAGDHTIEILANTHYGLTRHAFLGGHLCSIRMNPGNDADSIQRVKPDYSPKGAFLRDGN